MGDNVKIPEQVKSIIETLEENGYEAYAVGGCVRDTLLGRVPDDWDITTSANPIQVKALFRRTIDTGIQHGTVTVMIGDDGYEVTTYRMDGEYEDHRHPKEVLFTSNLNEDLKRRDFTINAMAYNPRVGIIDLYGGREDLEKKVIRCVGEANERFDEDALRMLRGIRFAGQLQFELEEKTFLAIKEKAPTLVNVSAERIRTELTKLIVSKGSDKLLLAVETGLSAYFLPELEKMLADKGKTDYLEEVVYPEHMAKFIYKVQEVQNGTASAINLAKEFVGDEPFAVLFGDDVMYNETRPVIGQLIDVYEKYGKTVLGCKRVSMDVISKYASVEYDKILENDVYNMTKVTEKPKKEEAKSDLAPLGRYVCSPGIFRIIDNLKPGANNEYQFTDALDLIARSEGALAYVFDGTRYDMGDRFGYLKANIEYGLRDAELKGKLKEYLKELIAE